MHGETVKFVFHTYLSQVSRRRGEIICIGDAVCDISSLWLYPCTNTVRKLDRFNMSSVEEHLRWKGRAVSSVRYWAVPIQVSCTYLALKVWLIMYVMLSDTLCECQVEYCRPLCELSADIVTEIKKKRNQFKLPVVSCVSSIYRVSQEECARLRDNVP